MGKDLSFLLIFYFVVLVLALQILNIGSIDWIDTPEKTVFDEWIGIMEFCLMVFLAMPREMEKEKRK